MDEMLCRGKRLDNDEWVKGFLLKGNNTYIATLDAVNYMVVSISGTACLELEVVAPETVGRYIGKRDKNGKRIFDKDIVKHYNWAEFPEHFVIHVVEWDAKRFRWSMRNPWTGECYTVGGDCIYEVIGNTIDNPELLQAENRQEQE